MSKTRRQNVIRNLLLHRAVQSQEEMLLLLEDAGISATQATVSRDLAAIGAYRGPGGYEVQNEQGIERNSGDEGERGVLVRDHTLSVKMAHNMVVVRTAPGHAQMLAAGFDRYPYPEVVGTVAGDDTIFLATTSPRFARAVLEHLEEEMSGG